MVVHHASQISERGGSSSELKPENLKTCRRCCQLFSLSLSLVLVVYFLGELTAVFNHDLLGGLAGGGTDLLDRRDDVHALGDGAEHDVLAVEPGGLHGAEEELGAVGVRTRVGHREDTRAGVLELEVLILQ